MIPIQSIQDLPHICGIYIVLDGQKQVIYIGQSEDIHKRWNSGHHKLAQIIASCGTDAYIDWVPVPKWLLNRAENAAYTTYKPKLNSKTPPII